MRIFLLIVLIAIFCVYLAEPAIAILWIAAGLFGAFLAAVMYWPAFGAFMLGFFFGWRD